MIISSQDTINQARKSAAGTTLKPYEIQFKKSPRANVTAWIRFYSNVIDAENDVLKVLAAQYNNAKLVAVIDL